MGDDNDDVERRHNACMQSYAPIAHSVFGNCCFRVKDRVSLARSLCFSRLLYNVHFHVWSSVSPWAGRRLNSGYMRVLRRIAVQPKYKNRSVDRRESPRVSQHARDSLLYLAEQVVLPDPTCERSCRQPGEPPECELSASVGHPGQTRLGATLDRSTPHVSVTWTPERQCDGLGGLHYTVPSPVEAAGAQLDSHGVSFG